jgi:hypothetical protein
MNSEINDFHPHFNGKVIEIRAMGYNTVAAILELTDNSVRLNCGSKLVRTILHKEANLLYRVSILDDGIGMGFDKLKESFIFNLVKDREKGDIGKYHVGMKYALIAMGSQITIISRVANGSIVGIFADIDQMSARNSFRPCEVSENVDEEWALRHITPTLWQEFNNSTSGTLVDVKNLVPSCRQSFDRMSDEVRMGLTNAYTSLYNSCIIRLESDRELIANINPNDMFYLNSPENLDEPAHMTHLKVYSQGVGRPHRVIEVNTQKRPLSSSSSKSTTIGTVKKPIYYEFTEYIHNKGSRQKANIQKITTIPEETDLIATLDVRVIQVKHDVYFAEEEQFPDGNKLALDRMGFWFEREIRCVGAAKQLGTKINSRASSSSLRQRMLIRTSSSADELIGSKFNKQMDENALPCRPLNDALLNIYNAVIRQWDNKYNELAAKKKAEAETKSEVENETESEKDEIESEKDEIESAEDEIESAEDETESEEEAELKSALEQVAVVATEPVAVPVSMSVTVVATEPVDVVATVPVNVVATETIAESVAVVATEAVAVVATEAIAEPVAVIATEPVYSRPVESFTISYNDNTMIVTDQEIVTKFPYFTDQAYITKDLIRVTKQALSEDRFRKWLKGFATLQKMA